MLVYRRLKLRGGALVKFAKILALVVLLGCSAAVAHADGDPTVKVNKFPDPGCPPADGADYTCFSSNSVDDPLMIPTDNVVANFVWDSTDALTDLYVEFAFTPGDEYGCTSNIFLNPCTVVEPASGGQADIEFHLSGGSIAGCIDGDCTGVSTDVAPEPSSVALLFAGLIVLFAFARKRFASQTAKTEGMVSA